MSFKNIKLTAAQTAKFKVDPTFKRAIIANAEKMAAGDASVVVAITGADGKPLDMCSGAPRGMAKVGMR